jgi:basic membrane protein A
MLAAIALVAVSAGAAKTDRADAAARGAAPAKSAAPAAAGGFKLALVTDVGGLNDRSFNFLANKGRLRAQKELKIATRVYISRSPQDYIPNLTAAVRDGNTLIIGVGFLMADAVNTVAKSFPNAKFGIIDFAWADLKDKPRNVRGMLFKEHEAGYLVGYLAGLTIKRNPVNGQRIVGAVGGVKIPPVDRFIAGYRAGARRGGATQTLINYSQDFVDQAKCKEQAINQITNGAGIIFQVAGGCGLGALDAAKEESLWGIGVDADQAYLGRHILTSAVKKVDVAVFLTAKAAKAQGTKFRGGFDSLFSVANGGVGIGKIAARVPAADKAKVVALQKLIAKRKVAIPDRL